MTLVLAIDFVAVCALVIPAARKGFECTLPLAACLMMLFPVESQIRLPGFFDLTTQRLLIVVLVVLYVVYGKAQKRPLPLKYLMLPLMAWMLLSFANSVVPEVSFKAVLSQFFDFFVPYYIFSKTVSKVETVHKVLFAFVTAMLVCSIFGFLESYEDWRVLSLFPPAPHRFMLADMISDRGIRAQSTFAHPILFGGALAMAIPQALYLLTLAKTRGRKVFLWSAIMLMFLNIYKTGSRGPWLALVFSLGILTVLGHNQIRKCLLTVALLTVTVLVARPGIWETIRNMYIATSNPDSVMGASYQWRYALYHIAVKELDKDSGRALWGYGPESFFFLGIKDEFEGHMVKYDTCDSSIAGLMIETGYVGLLITALLLLKPAFVAYRSFRKAPKPANSLCLVLLVNMLAFYFLMTNVAIYGWGQESYMLWILIAFTMIYPRLQRDSRVAEDYAPPEPQPLEPTAF